MTTLYRFHIHYRDAVETADNPAALLWACDAESPRHALEQFEDEPSHAGVAVLSVANVEALVQAGGLGLDADALGHTLVESAECAWITVDNASVCVKRTDEGVVVDLYPLGLEDRDAVASTYAFSAELADDALVIDALEDHQRAAHVAALQSSPAPAFGPH